MENLDKERWGYVTKHFQSGRYRPLVGAVAIQGWVMATGASGDDE